MSDTKKLTPAKFIAYASSAIGLLLMLVWGVPYYLKAEVHDLYVEELKASPHPVTTADLAAAIAVGTALQLQLASMEQRMIDRDKLFMDYLQDQASRGD